MIWRRPDYDPWAAAEQSFAALDAARAGRQQLAHAPTTTEDLYRALPSSEARPLASPGGEAGAVPSAG